MELIHLEVQKRESGSTGQLKKMRREGWIPAVLYDSSSAKNQNLLLKVPEKALLKVIALHHSSSTIVELKWDSAVQAKDSQSVNALIKEIQTELISKKLLHIDFQKIKLTEKIEVMVALRLVGDAPGVKLHGGILEHITRELKIIALPKDIPPYISADISHLEIGQGIFVKDLPALPGVEILTDPNHLIANVVAPKAEEEAPAIAEPTAVEPEVIAKGKKPEEGEEAQSPAATKPQDKTPSPSK